MGYLWRFDLEVFNASESQIDFIWPAHQCKVKKKGIFCQHLKIGDYPRKSRRQGNNHTDRKGTQMVKNLPAIQESWILSLGQEDPLEKGIATTPVFLPGELHGQRSLVTCSPWGHKQSNMTE